ncbi:MAG: L,D-transpeptidase family protein, partial [Burkholderiales bacterium]|nr:L,D-transpeptidase family protein [Burkholderiales bacterium]
VFIFDAATIAKPNLSEPSIIKYSLQKKQKFCTMQIICQARASVEDFYQLRKYNAAWTNADYLNDAGTAAVQTLTNAYQNGLNPNKYHVDEINKMLAQLDSDNISDAQVDDLLASLDISITDGMALYAHDVYYGTLDVKKIFPYWVNNKKSINITQELEAAAKDPDGTIKNLEPKFPGYAKLKKMLLEYQAIANDGGFPLVSESNVLTIGDKGDAVKDLQQRLLVSGELAQNNKPGKFDSNLQQAVITFQDNNGLYDDGIVESQTFKALNTSVGDRIKLIELNLDKMRLLPQDLGPDYLFINLPSFSLNVVHNGKQFINMEVAVGGVEHPSCVLNSQIQYLVLNPYWNIPAHIAQDEIWVSVKKNKNYLKQKHVQVLKKNNRGDYVPINVDKFNWNTISVKEFNSYRFRQEPSDENALGKVKFMFPNQCGMYLHSTNESELFDAYQRDFSHGCVRVNQPLNLTTFILNIQKQWSSAKVSSMYQKDFNKTIHLVKPFNLYLFYLTALDNDSGWVQFRKDIYDLDKSAINNYSVNLPPLHNN